MENPNKGVPFVGRAPGIGSNRLQDLVEQIGISNWMKIWSSWIRPQREKCVVGLKFGMRTKSSGNPGL